MKMSIDKINSVNNYNGYNKIDKIDSSKNINSTDSINISNEAISKAESNKMLDIVKNAPDVRADKIAEIKEKLKNPDYINDKIVNSLSDKIMENFGV
jgi:negative regulator of flagellin synthesis FlgM